MMLLGQREHPSQQSNNLQPLVPPVFFFSPPPATNAPVLPHRASDFVLSTISAILCMVYLARERPHPVEEGKPKRPDPVKATRSPVPCYFRYLQHISWVLACISSMIVSVVFWMAIVSLVPSLRAAGRSDNLL